MADGMDDDALNNPSSGDLSIQPDDAVSPGFMSEQSQDNVVKLDQKTGRRPKPPETAPQSNPHSTLQHPGKQAEIVSFDRRELDLILRLYGFKVAAGEWRDYAIDMLRERAVFSVFRRSAEVPLYSIEKNPKLARKQGAWSVTGADGRVLKRGHDLTTVLKILEKRAKLRVV